VLIAGKDGKPRHDFRGRLSFHGPSARIRRRSVVGQPGYDPQFAYGFGLSYAAPVQTPRLPEVVSTVNYGDRGVYFTKGTFWNGYGLKLEGASSVAYTGKPVSGGAITAEPSPRDPQAVHLTWSGKGGISIAAASPSDLSREANGSMMVSLTLDVAQAPSAPVQLVVGGISLPIGPMLHAAPTISRSRCPASRARISTASARC
jgi:beta-glucosidase